MPRFSLIIPTIGRPTELRRLLESLRLQTLADFEVIIVDQSQSPILAPIIAQYTNCLRLTYLASSEKGASRARNLGRNAASGDLLAWPDDDSYYPVDLLEKVDGLFTAHPDWDGVAVSRCDESGKPDSRWEPRQQKQLKPTDFFFLAGEAAIFYRHQSVENIGDFDEYLGVGAGTPWGAGEAADFQTRAFRLGYKTWFAPEINIYHPALEMRPENAQLVAKLTSYARGMGAVLRKQHFPIGFVLTYFLLYLFAAIRSASILRFDVAMLQWQRLICLIEGWLRYNGRA